MRPSLRVAALLAAFASVPAHAEGGLVDQVEKLEIEQGEFEVEGQFILADDDDGQTLLLGTTFEYGLSDSFQIGVELEAERESGDSLALESVNLQFKWAALDPEDHPLGLGIQSAMVIETASGAIGTETFLIAESRLGALDATANFILETEPGDLSDAASAYAVRLDGEVPDPFTLGVEAGGALSGEGAGSHFIGPVLGIPFGGEEGGEVELSLFAPITREAPDWQVRLEVDLAF